MRRYEEAKRLYDVPVRRYGAPVRFYEEASRRYTRSDATSDYFPQRRVMERITVIGDRPY